jgi:hypothetical protein
MCSCKYQRSGEIFLLHFHRRREWNEWKSGYVIIEGEDYSPYLKYVCESNDQEKERKKVLIFVWFIRWQAVVQIRPSAKHCESLNDYWTMICEGCGTASYWTGVCLEGLKNITKISAIISCPRPRFEPRSTESEATMHPFDSYVRFTEYRNEERETEDENEINEMFCLLGCNVV